MSAVERPFASLFFLDLLLQPSNLKVLPDNNHHHGNREDWPDDAEDPDVDSVVTYTEQLGKPEKNPYAQVKQSINDYIAGSDWRAVHSIIFLKRTGKRLVSFLLFFRYYQHFKIFSF